ncbi:hypothetical protein evm_001285 [Chilo suppressalis]|nr:hypothetical protein evm_001285 [Chilo suppressalis]
MILSKYEGLGLRSFSSVGVMLTNDAGSTTARRRRCGAAQETPRPTAGVLDRVVTSLILIYGKTPGDASPAGLFVSRCEYQSRELIQTSLRRQPS